MAGKRLEIEVPSPDLAPGLYPGEPTRGEHAGLRARGMRVWADLAEVLGLRLLVPRPAEPPFTTLVFEVMDQSADLHAALPTESTMRYGATSPFTRIDKLEDPWFLHTYRLALEEIAPRPDDRVLFAGCGRGDEIALLLSREGIEPERIRITGIDHAGSALDAARARFPHARFLEADLGRLDILEDVRYALIVAIGVLQSPGLDGKSLFQRLLDRHLCQRAGVIIAWPNVRYVDGELCFGARSKNYRSGELGLLVKDLAWYRGLLAKRGFTTTIRGKYDLILSARRT